MNISTRRTLIVTLSSTAPVALVLAASVGLAHCSGSSGVDLGDASAADSSAGSDSSTTTDGSSSVDARSDAPVTTDAAADAARDGSATDGGRDGGGDGGGDGGRDGGGDAGRDAGNDAGDSGTTQDSGATDAGSDASDAGATDAGSDAAADAGSDASDSGGENAALEIQNCDAADYVDRTAANAERTVVWGFTVGTTAARCMKVKAGQSVLFTLETAQVGFNIHPVIVPPQDPGDANNPIGGLANTGTSQMATFPTAGTYGFVCGNFHPGMQGAIWVVP
ncbi:MAG: hypothetical protein U0169_21565 [Polyangiaceae bacterium]